MNASFVYHDQTRMTRAEAIYDTIQEQSSMDIATIHRTLSWTPTLV